MSKILNTTVPVSVYPGYGITGIWTPRHVDINAVPIYDETQKSLSQCLYDCQTKANCRCAWHNEFTCKLYRVNRYSEDEQNDIANFIDQGTSRVWEYYDTGRQILWHSFTCHASSSHNLMVSWLGNEFEMESIHLLHKIVFSFCYCGFGDTLAASYNNQLFLVKPLFRTPHHLPFTKISSKLLPDQTITYIYIFICIHIFCGW